MKQVPQHSESSPLSCEQARLSISDHYDDSVPAPLAVALRNHLETCDSCARRFSEFGTALSGIRSLPRHPVPAAVATAVFDAWDGLGSGSAPEGSLSPPRSTRVFRWAAAALILIGLGLFMGYLELRFRAFGERLDLARSGLTTEASDAQRELSSRWTALEAEIGRLRGELQSRERTADRREAELQARIASLTSEVAEFAAFRSRAAVFEGAEARLVALEQRWAATWEDVEIWQHDLRSRLQGVVELIAAPRIDGRAARSEGGAIAERGAEGEDRPVEVILAKSGSISLRFDRKNPLAIDQLFLLHESSDEALRSVVTQQLDSIFRERVPELGAAEESTLGIRGIFASRVRDDDLGQDEAARIQSYWDFWQQQRPTQSPAQ